MKLGKSITEIGNKYKNQIHDGLLFERKPMPSFGFIDWITDTAIISGMTNTFFNLNLI